MNRHLPDEHFVIKDSGQREEFDTGSVRDTREGKGRFDLISPFALERLAQWYEMGATKYGERNWEKGQPVSRFMDSALRHLNRHMQGHRDEDHLSAALWNVAAIIHIEAVAGRGLLPAELFDLPDYGEAS
ncbi:MAG: dATP/dGTP diphosphohydrolase domain-containing protein [Planctomycetota bacterium]